MTTQIPLRPAAMTAIPAGATYYYPRAVETD